MRPDQTATDPSGVAEDPGTGPTPPQGELGEQLARAAVWRELFGKTHRAPRVGRYTLRRTLGAGGMGIVYAAHDAELGREVAIKVLTCSPGTLARGRLQREAQAMAQLSHPNVVQVYEVGAISGQVYVAMELVAGHTLRCWSESEGRSAGEVLAAYRQAGLGLAAAHDAGLVHRDFKPDNAMIDAAGRVRVMDFGLARAAQDTPRADPADGSAALTRLTLTGAVVGTPAYMAPEQFSGLEVGARTDQFQFCVALWEALCGSRPFAGDSVPELLTNVRGGVLREPSSGRRPQKPIRRALERGLAVDPDQRWPDMTALLGALEPRRRTWPGVAALAVAAVAGSAFFFSRDSGPVCTDGAETPARAWDEARSTALAGALAANASWPRIEARMDAWVEEYKTRHLEACAATSLLDERMACLTAGRAELHALVEALARAEPETVERGVEAVEALPRLERCRDEDGLVAELPLPQDPAMHEEIMAIRAGLAELRALNLLGTTTVQQARDVVARAERTDYRPVVAEAYNTLSDALKAADDVEASATAAEKAYTLAVSTGHDRAAFEAAVRQVGFLSEAPGRIDEAAVWERRASAHLTRLGATAWDRVLLARASTYLAAARGDYERALAKNEEELALSRKIYGGPRAADVSTLSIQSRILGSLGRASEALATAREAVTLGHDTYGDNHPDVAAAHEVLGYALAVLGKHEDALPQYDLARAAQPDASPAAMDLRQIRATSVLRLGRLEEAQSEFEACIKARVQSYGEYHETVAESVGSLAATLYLQGDKKGALEQYNRALAIREATLPPGHDSLAGTLHNIAAVLLDLGEYDRSLKNDRRALEIIEDALGPEHPGLFSPLNGIGNALIKLGRAQEAIAYQRRAMAIIEASDAATIWRAYAKQGLAEALIHAGEDVKRARELALEARGVYLEAGRAEAMNLAQIDALLGGGDEVAK